MRFEIEPKIGLGNFILGMNINQVLTLIKRNGYYYKHCKIISNKEKNTPIFLYIPSEQITLRFNYFTQNLELIEKRIIFANDNNINSSEANADSEYYYKNKLFYIQNKNKEFHIIKYQNIAQLFGLSKVPKKLNKNKNIFLEYSGIGFYFTNITDLEKSEDLDISADASSVDTNSVLTKFLIFREDSLYDSLNKKNTFEINDILIKYDSKKSKSIVIKRNNDNNESMITIGDNIEDVLRELKHPNYIYYSNENNDTNQTQDNGDALYNQTTNKIFYLNYFKYGFDIMICNNKVNRIILHTNQIGDSKFGLYERCNFKLKLRKDYLSSLIKVKDEIHENNIEINNKKKEEKEEIKIEDKKSKERERKKSNEQFEKNINNENEKEENSNSKQVNSNNKKLKEKNINEEKEINNTNEKEEKEKNKQTNSKNIYEQINNDIETEKINEIKNVSKGNQTKENSIKENNKEKEKEISINSEKEDGKDINEDKNNNKKLEENNNKEIQNDNNSSSDDNQDNKNKELEKGKDNNEKKEKNETTEEVKKDEEKKEEEKKEEEKIEEKKEEVKKDEEKKEEEKKEEEKKEEEKKEEEKKEEEKKEEENKEEEKKEEEKKEEEKKEEEKKEDENKPYQKNNYTSNKNNRKRRKKHGNPPKKKNKINSKEESQESEKEDEKNIDEKIKNEAKKENNKENDYITIFPWTDFKEEFLTKIEYNKNLRHQKWDEGTTKIINCYFFNGLLFEIVDKNVIGTVIIY